MSLIHAGIAHHVSSNTWSNILHELHVCEHDIRELKYLHSMLCEMKTHWKFGYPPKKYEPFSGFGDQNSYCRFSPS